MEEGFGELSDGVGPMLLTLGNALVQTVFLAVSFVGPLASSTSWMNWLMARRRPHWLSRSARWSDDGGHSEAGRRAACERAPSDLHAGEVPEDGA